MKRDSLYVGVAIATLMIMILLNPIFNKMMLRLLISNSVIVDEVICAVTAAIGVTIMIIWMVSMKQATTFFEQGSSFQYKDFLIVLYCFTVGLGISLFILGSSTMVYYNGFLARDKGNIERYLRNI